ncbi:hypothetical protein [Spiroplasma diminutum]|uniref:Uncharacterized protein n=1 Tax=Spiroplasma diminutum CUAS-1 TaxID=1276221 RepID=S5MEX1_9MOLU|nr:hypothetical protein [Spiroplasma diminutum]AGR42323.1 hypothetical protein SDIMI_v3c06190 [Spiroplasma diminutum CUAS-1]
MNNTELLLKIQELEKELENYKSREEYTKKGLERTKSVYEVARKNAEIIISKAVNLAYDLKNDIEETLVKIEQNPIDFTIYLELFLNKNEHFINNKDEKINEYLETIIDSLDKSTN